MFFVTGPLNHYSVTFYQLILWFSCYKSGYFKSWLFIYNYIDERV